MSDTTRRQFSKAAVAATALSYSRILGANDKVRMGYIGLGNRGDQVHDAFLEHGDQQTAAVCDLRDDYMEFAIKKSRATPKKYRDYKKLLDDKEIDAVAIATPDHWHALMFVDACRAGKDVYVEKPLSLTVWEGRRMVQVAAETKRVTQVGIHRRSVQSLRDAAEFVRNGGLGHVTVAKGYHVQNEWPNGIGNNANTVPPNEAEWDAWLGPAPKVPYNRNRTYYNFRWFYDYSGGQITNFGVHYMDWIRMALGKEAPKSVVAMGGRYAVKDNREIPDTCEVLWDFGETMVVFSQYNANGAPTNAKNSELEIRGTKGTMYLQSGRWEVVPEKTTETLFGYRTPLDRVTEKGYGQSKKPAMEAKVAGSGFAETYPHARNFLDCLKSRKKCNCDVVEGHLSTSATIIGHIALRTKSYLEWDAKTEKFTNNAAANRYLSYQYRAPYKLG
ncbi:MAG: Gfo/Idh/MocA family oxidoreductase [Acidobacteria bacterium]|nr:Gfo/Idh/MocA family oxidoreductase [Acidobacteriota bacterium]